MIRCLVVDDSRTFRATLRAILARAPDIEVAGEAADGHQAVAEVLRLKPDVVTMDVRMPGKDGLAAIEEIMRLRPTPVVVVSAEAGPENQGIAFRALDVGAIEVLAKPRSGAQAFEHDADAIRTAVRTVAGLKLITRRRPAASARKDATPAWPASETAQEAIERARAAFTPWPPLRVRPVPRAIGIAASTGGPAVLAHIFRGLPATFPVPILVVQHIAEGFDAGLAHWLAGETGLRVKLARDGEPLAPGTAWIAPNGKHLGVAKDRVRLFDGAPVKGFCPSGSVLLSTIALEYGAAAAGLVLSGMGDDGADGLAEMRARGGWTGAQGAQSCAVYGMPRAAIERGAAERTIELDDLAPSLLRLARSWGPERQ